MNDLTIIDCLALALAAGFGFTAGAYAAVMLMATLLGAIRTSSTNTYNINVPPAQAAKPEDTPQ